jgi:hypothetical protein
MISTSPTQARFAIGRRDFRLRIKNVIILVSHSYRTLEECFDRKVSSRLKADTAVLLFHIHDAL